MEIRERPRGAALALRSFLRRHLLLLLFLLASCSAKRPIDVHSVAGFAAEWRQAQADVARLEPPVQGDPYAVEPSRFLIDREGEPFYCGTTGLQAVLLVYGCFRADHDLDAGPSAITAPDETLGTIRYFPGKTGALRHEARHAILFALGDHRWSDVGH